MRKLWIVFFSCVTKCIGTIFKKMNRTVPTIHKTTIDVSKTKQEQKDKNKSHSNNIFGMSMAHVGLWIIAMVWHHTFPPSCGCWCKLIGSLQITNINGNINTNVKFLFKTSHAALILNRNFTFVLMFPFMFVIRKLPNMWRPNLLSRPNNIFGKTSHHYVHLCMQIRWRRLLFHYRLTELTICMYSQETILECHPHLLLHLWNVNVRMYDNYNRVYIHTYDWLYNILHASILLDAVDVFCCEHTHLGTGIISPMFDQGDYVIIPQSCA